MPNLMTILLRAYATIPDIFYELFNTPYDQRLMIPLYSFGFFVAMAFLVAALVTNAELKRRAKLGFFQHTTKKVIEGEQPKWSDFVGTFIITFVFAWKLGGMLLNWGDVQADIQGYILSTRGNLIIGIVIAAAYTYWEYYKVKKKALDKPVEKTVMVFPHDRLGAMVVVAAVSGILGANVLEIINKGQEYWEAFLQDPLMSMFSGFTIVGGLLFGGLAMYLYARSKKINFLHLFDSLAPGVMLAYGVGRIGCQVSGDGDWGIPVAQSGWTQPGWLPDWLWAQHFEHNIINENTLIEGCQEAHCHMLANPVFPTSIYETILAALLFVVLFSIRKRLQVFPGMLFAIWLIFIGMERFLIEFIRVTKKYEVLGVTLTMQQMVSLGFTVLGLTLIYVFYKRGRKKPIQKKLKEEEAEPTTVS